MNRYRLKSYYIYHEKKFNPKEFIEMLNYAIDKAATKGERNKNYAANEDEVIDVLCKKFEFTQKEDELIIETSNDLFYKVDINKLNDQSLSDTLCIDITNTDMLKKDKRNEGLGLIFMGVILSAIAWIPFKIIQAAFNWIHGII